MHPDVIIIGGGVIGTACAYFLANKGARVKLLERSHLASGASGCTAAIISVSGSGSTPEALHTLSLESYNLVLDHEPDFDPPLETIRGGALYVAMSEAEDIAIRPFYEDLRQMGIDCSMMDGPQARGFEPILADHATSAVYNPACFHVNPFRLGAAYLNAALRKGGAVEYGVEVQNLAVKNDKIEFVGFENRITLEKLTAFTRSFTRSIPLLAKVRALRFFAGFRPICEDNLPVIGPVPGCSKLIVASGHGRTGVRFSASTGKAVSEMVVDGQTEHLMEAFSPGRFV